ncbi:MAG TPA: hypothetical protein VGE51_06660 [Fontimonas sp.]
MNASQLIGNAKGLVSETRSTATLIQAHGRDLARTGVEILQAARDVVIEGGRESARVIGRTREELHRTLSDGAEQIRYKLAHLKTPTHKEHAEARKAAIKQKKQRKRAAGEEQRSPA